MTKSVYKLPYFSVILLGCCLPFWTLVHSEDRVPPTRPESIKVPPESPSFSNMPEKQEKPKEEKKKETRRIGPYQALTFNRDVLQEVVYRNEDNTVWLRLRPEVRNKEIVVKISNQKFANYRKWLDRDGYELISPANSGKEPNALTDWLQTRAPYIEYYMDGELFLHLKREEF